MPKYATGQIIGTRYEVLDYLGDGATGEVYKVFDRHQGFECALKLLGPNSSGATGPWHEAQILTELQSDFILPVRNADTFAGLPFLVTDIATSGTAADAMEPVGVEPTRAVRWISAACHGAARTHDAGLIHRDIKPANLFLIADDAILLGDFGMAALMGPDGSAGRDGTPVTVAPEVAAGGSTTIRSDVYSLGASLYALLAGRYRHNAPTKAAVLAAIRAGPGTQIRDAAPHVNRGVANCVEKAMARDPHDRYANATAFAAALSNVVPPLRRWRRTDEHGHHRSCWRGEATGRAEAVICCIEAGSGRHAHIEARYVSGRTITEACRPRSTYRNLARQVRSAIRSIG